MRECTGGKPTERLWWGKAKDHPLDIPDPTSSAPSAQWTCTIGLLSPHQRLPHLDHTYGNIHPSPVNIILTTRTAPAFQTSSLPAQLQPLQSFSVPGSLQVSSHCFQLSQKQLQQTSSLNWVEDDPLPSLLIHSALGGNRPDKLVPLQGQDATSHGGRQICRQPRAGCCWHDGDMSTFLGCLVPALLCPCMQLNLNCWAAGAGMQRRQGKG